MSRIGKKPILIPDDVTISINGDALVVKGPKGELSMQLRPEIEVTIEDKLLTSQIKQETKQSSAIWGMTRAIIANLIIGVTEGYEKRLELVGVGYRANQSGSGAQMNLGYSHSITFEPPEGVKLVVEDNKTLIVSGIDKQLVGQTAAKIRALRKPEVYKGKGIKYVDEVIKTKPGKAGKVA